MEVLPGKMGAIRSVDYSLDGKFLYAAEWSPLPFPSLLFFSSSLFLLFSSLPSQLFLYKTLVLILFIFMRQKIIIPENKRWTFLGISQEVVNFLIFILFIQLYF